ncbi:MAG: DUF481 domain-containing protein [Cystobacter sp.]
MLPAVTLLSLVLAQAPSETPAATERATAAAEAAERAAVAAERAAAANARIAESLQRLAEQLAGPGAVPVPTEPAPPAEPAKSKEAENWDVTMGMGLIFVTGNASTVTLNGLASAQRKTERWIYSAQASGVYGESRAPTLEGQAPAPNQVVALNAALQLRADRRFTPQLSGYVLTRGETDHVKSVEFRGSGELGVGVIWWEQKRPEGGESFLRTDLALSYARELRFQYYPSRTDLPDVSLGGPRAGLAFRHGLTQDIAIVEELSVLPSLIERSRLLITNQAQLNVRLTRTLAIATTFLVQYDSLPAAGKLNTDTSLAVSASVTF